MKCAANDYSSDKVQQMEVFLKDFRNLSERERSDRIDSFVSNFQEVFDASLSEASFNLFEITGVGDDEVRHSSILAWLLNPRSRHTCRTLFLRSFLKVAGIVIPEEQIRDCSVRTEFPGTESTIDILIYRLGSFIIYLENKTKSPEGDKQVDREYRDLRCVGKSVRVPENMMFPIFLTPSGRKPISGDPEPWRTISYRDLAEEFRTLLPEIKDQKTYFLVQDLIKIYQHLEGQ